MKYKLVIVMLVLSACVKVAPIQINSDPNLERLERAQEDMEKDNVEAFIAEHPELDAETKKALRDGTMSRSAAEEKLKRR